MHRAAPRLPWRGWMALNVAIAAHARLAEGLPQVYALGVRRFGSRLTASHTATRIPLTLATSSAGANGLVKTKTFTHRLSLEPLFAGQAGYRERVHSLGTPGRDTEPRRVRGYRRRRQSMSSKSGGDSRTIDGIQGRRSPGPRILRVPESPGRPSVQLAPSGKPGQLDT